MSTFVQTCQIKSTNVNIWFTSVTVKKNSPDPTRGRENIGAGDRATSPRTKKQSTGLFFAACEPPSCSSPTVTKNLAQPRRAARDFGAGDRARTGTSVTSRDFKSRASANSATPARAPFGNIVILSHPCLHVNTFLQKSVVIFRSRISFFYTHFPNCTE